MLSAATLTALAACSSGSTSASPPASASSSAGTTEDPGEVVTLQPGLPGEAASTGPVEVPEPEPENHSDIAFMQMMIPHHAQAIDMAKLAQKRAQDDAVRAIAERVRAGQGPEILFMAAWLEERNVDVPSAADDPNSFDHSAHGHDGMVGMLTPAQMEALARARGERFDRLFLRRMIQHHEGAIQMASVVADGGTDLTVSEVAADVASTQLAEVARMRDVLRRL